MAEARRRHDWQQTAGLMALIANVLRGKKGSPVKPEHFHPLAGPGGRSRGRGVVKGEIGILKTVFIDRKVPTVLGS